MIVTPPQSPLLNDTKTCDSSAIKFYKANSKDCYMNQLIENSKLLKDLTLITQTISTKEIEIREKILKISDLESKLSHIRFYFEPVDPNPPAPRSVLSKSST